MMMLTSIAWRDLAHNPLSTICLILGAAIALSPVLLLFGLNYGFVNRLIEQLREDPRTRELRPVGQYELTQDWFEERALDPRVGFILPRTRYLASTTRLRSPNARGVHDAELIPTAAGDPLLPGDISLAGVNQIAISASTAANTSAASGDELTLIFTRRTEEGRQSVRLKATVIAVLDRSAYQREAVFAVPDLVDKAERWREGEAVPSMGERWAEGADPKPRSSYASFRMFAKDVRDVPALRDAMIGMRIDVRTEEAAISRALAIERGLGWVFVVILALSASGVLLTLGFQLAASIAEKASELSILRMMGMESLQLMSIPVIQGSIIGAAGASVAALSVLLSQPLINDRLAGIAGLDGPLSELLVEHALIAVLAMAVAGALAGGFAGRQAAKLEPSEGLRRD